MADNNYTNKLGLDTSEFTKAIKEANSNLRVIAQQVNATRLGVVDYNTAVSSLTKNITEHTNKQSALKKKYDLLKDSLGENALQTKKVEAELEKEKNALIKAEQALKDYKEGLSNTSNNCKDLCHALTQMEMAVYDLAKTLATNACKALVNFTKETINTGMQFESAFAGVRKVVDGTEEDFKELENEIRQTALERPISAEQLSSIYQMGSQLGIAKDGLKDFSNSIIDLAKTSNLTEEAGATMIAQYANVMKLPQEDYRRFASTLSYLGSTTATTESDIMELMSRLSGAGATIGLTHQDLLALSTAMGSVGINAEAGGSAISTILSKISMDVDKNSETLITWANVAGMTAEEFKVAWKEDTMSAIQAVISGLGDAKKGGESLNIILDDLGINNIRQLDTMKKLANASELLTEDIAKANKEWETASFLGSSASQVYNTVESQLQILKNTFAEMKISIYEGFKEPLAEAMKELSNFLKTDDAKKFATEFSNAIKSAISVLVILIKGLVKNFDKVIAVIKTAAAALVGFITAKVINSIASMVNSVKNFVTSLLSLVTQLLSATSAQNALNIAMASNPIGMVATLVGLLVSGIAMLAMNYKSATNATKEHTKELEKQKQELIENRKTREENLAGIESETNHTKGLVEELKTLVDENGKVKDGCQDRVNTLLPLIQNATGVEIECINGQITKYNELIGTLEDVIEKKRLEAKINAYQGDYDETFRVEDEENEKLRKNIELTKATKEKLDEAKKALDEQVAKDPRSAGFLANNVKNLQAEYDELIKQNKLILDGFNERADIRAKYEGLLKEQNALNNSNQSNTGTKISSNAGTEAGTAYAESYNKAVVTGAKETSKTVNKEMEELTNNTVTTNLTLNDETYGGLVKKESELKEQLSTMQKELTQGNQNITTDMLNNVSKQIDQVESKIKSLKGEWDELGEDGEISDDFVSENTNLKSKGVIFGKGVLGDNAVEMEGAGKDAAAAYLEGYKAEQERINEQLALDAQNRANQEALNYQMATIDPANIEVYDQTEKYLAESKQTSQAQGLEENAYKVVNAETWTLNQAIAAAMQIDFTVVGKYICDGIAAGIEQNKHVVIDAVRSMMEEANDTAEDTKEIGSPSKVFYKYGKFMDMGLANGIRDYAKSVSNEVKLMTSRANEAIGLANSQLENRKYGALNTAKGTSGVTEINYNFTQNNTSAKSLDTLAIYQQSKSMLKRVARNQYV